MSGVVSELDRSVITRVLNDYARGVDDRDWDRVVDCYHVDAYDDHGVYRGGPLGLVAHFAEHLDGYAGTLHLLGSPDLGHVDDNEVDATTACLALHWRKPGAGGKHLVMIADYDDRFSRRDEIWRVAKRTVRVRHAEELVANPEIWPLARLFETSEVADDR